MTLRRLAVLFGLAVSLATLAAAPNILPGSYSWVSHTTSESAAQGVEGAWLARSGFFLFGLAVLGLVRINHEAWGAWGTWVLACFAVLMIAAAVFSARSWEEGASYDATEDALHSVAATATGFAFAFGVVAVSLRRTSPRRRMPDVIAVARPWSCLSR